jgi:hypothetical protein
LKYLFLILAINTAYATPTKYEQCIEWAREEMWHDVRLEEYPTGIEGYCKERYVPITTVVRDFKSIGTINTVTEILK